MGWLVVWLNFIIGFIEIVHFNFGNILVIFNFSLFITVFIVILIVELIIVAKIYIFLIIRFIWHEHHLLFLSFILFFIKLFINLFFTMIKNGLDSIFAFERIIYRFETLIIVSLFFIIAFLLLLDQSCWLHTLRCFFRSLIYFMLWLFFKCCISFRSIAAKLRIIIKIIWQCCLFFLCNWSVSFYFI